MSTVPEEWQAMADELRGSTGIGVDVDELMGVEGFPEWLDTQVFCCTQCGWWCDISEEASEDHGLEEWTCADCCEESP